MPVTAHLEPFNSVTGRQAGLKSARVLRELIDNGRRFATQQLQTIKGESVVQDEVQRQIDLSEEQLNRTRRRLNAVGKFKVKDKERAALLRELRGLMEHLCRLRGIGEPARVRPSNEVNLSRRTVPRQLPPAVVQAEPAPTPPVDNTPNP